MSDVLKESEKSPDIYQISECAARILINLRLSRTLVCPAPSHLFQAESEFVETPN